MNVYDFDKTICSKDSAVEFFKHCLKKYPKIITILPNLASHYIQQKRNKISRATLKTSLYQYLKYVDDIEQEAKIFWDENMHLIQPWYLNQKRKDDLIASASPEFLIKEICQRLEVNWLASPLNLETLSYDGINNWGSEKVRRFYEAYPDGYIEKFYSDHLSDSPLAKIAMEAYLVEGDKIKPWPIKDLVEDKYYQ